MHTHSAFLPLFVELISLRHNSSSLCSCLLKPYLRHPLISTVPGTYWGPPTHQRIGMGEDAKSLIAQGVGVIQNLLENTITNWETRKNKFDLCFILQNLGILATMC